MSSIEQWVRDKFKLVELSEEHLHEYQTEMEAFAYANRFSALFADTGLGKTPVLLKLIHRLVMNEECKNVLVIAPRRVAEITWPDEIAKWHFAAPLTHTIIREDVLVDEIKKAGLQARRESKLQGHSKPIADAFAKDARLKAGKKAVRKMMTDRPASIFLIHKEQIEFLVESFERDWPFDTVIIDESSSLKDHRTNRWKALWRVRPLIKRLHELTATPASESYLHLFAQITLLDRGERLGLSFDKYAKRYFTQNKYTMKWEPRDGAIEEITEKISDICVVLKQEDYLDLQQPVMSPMYVHLDDKQMQLYKTMEDDFIIELDDGTEVEAETASALSQKLLQMASGVVYNTVLEEVSPGEFKKRRDIHHLHDSKIEALAQLEEELNGESMLVAYFHQSSLDRIQKAFPHAEAMDKAGKLIAKWNKGKIKMLLIHPQSDAHGLNLQKGGRHVVFFDSPWSYENFYQLYRRLARQGQEFLVVIHQIIARGTRDEDVAEVLRNKGDVQEVFFKLIMKMRRKRARERQRAFILNDDNEL